MISSNSITFGLKNGVSVEVSEVLSGLACGCICPACSGKLQANKSKSKNRVSYFSHDPSEDTQSCTNAFETSVHFMAKQILSEEAYICYPSIYIKRIRFDLDGELHLKQKMGITSSKVSFTEVKLEKKVSSIRPDIIAYRDKKLLLIEIAVTHFVDLKKKGAIRELGLPCIEINLSSISRIITKKELKPLVVDTINNKKWLSNPNMLSVINEVEALLDETVYEANELMQRKKELLVSNLNKQEKAKPKNNKSKKKTEGSKTNHFKKTKIEKHLKTELNDLRWFACENCLLKVSKSSKAVFTIKQNDAPYNSKIVICPKCGAIVTTTKAK